MKTQAPLSKVQYGIYAECIGYEGEARYNLPYLYVLDASLDGERLAHAIETAVAAHPTLFTRIEQGNDGEPLQTIDDSETFSLNIEHGTFNIEKEKAQLVQPFNIVGDRLFHIRLLKDAAHYYFSLDIHHIIGDGTTLKVMLSDVEKAYNGEPLEPEALTMAQVAIAEAELRKTAAFDEGRQWYAQNFDCGDCYTSLLPDKEEPEHTEASMVRTLGVDMTQVDTFCKENGIFKCNFFTTVYSFLLAKYNNEQEYTTEDVIDVYPGLFHTRSTFTGPRHSPNRTRTSFTLSILNVFFPCSRSLTNLSTTPALSANSTWERPFFFRFFLICSDKVISIIP